MNQTKEVYVVLSSSRGKDSASTALALRLGELISKKTKAVLSIRHLGTQPVSQVNEKFLSALSKSSKDRSADEQALVSEHDREIYRVQQADVIVVAAPTYNFMTPVCIKEWFDSLARAGVTFSYNEKGIPEGKLLGKKLIVVQTTGGIYSDEQNLAKKWITQIAAFIGMTDVEFIQAQGLAYGAESAKSSMEKAFLEVQRVSDTIKL